MRSWKVCARASRPKSTSSSRKKTTYEWYNEALTDVLDATKEFSSAYCSVLGTSSMLKPSTYSTYAVTSNSDSSAVTVTASGSADAGTVSVRVDQLAVQANVSSSGKVSADGTGISSSNTATLGSLSFANALTFSKDGKISFSINGKAFSFTKDTTLQSMINTVNNDEDANVTMKYSRLTDTFTITADSGGADSKVSITNIAGNAFGKNGAFGIAGGTVKNGRNSVAEINGTLVEKDTNTYTADGITYTLNAVTAASGDSVVVRQLAKNASVSSSGGVSAGGTVISADNTAKLSDLSLKNALTFDGDGNLSFSINGKPFTFSQDTTLQDMLDTVNSDEDAGVTMQYSRLKDAFTITADSGGAGSTVSIVNGSGNAFGQTARSGSPPARSGTDRIPSPSSTASPWNATATRTPSTGRITS
jgi:flagellar hook-associated protein 2